MNFETITTNLAGVLLLKVSRFNDSRGFFSEVYKAKDFESYGIPPFVQDNLSESSLGVIRGLHWQEPPYGQGKLVACVKGRILDVAVDVNRKSETFGNHVAFELSESNGFMLWIPEGFAHGFQSLENNSRVLYKVTNIWHKESERSLNALDPEIGINWLSIRNILSDKDLSAPNLKNL
jgi:dTDP-4-dehydrorhamnose 3,5-epimerase